MANPNARPYDPNQLADLTAHIAVNGPVVSSPEQHVVHAPVVVPEAYPAFGGLRRIFSRDARAEYLQHRINTVRLVGETIDNPRAPKSDPVAYAKQRIGWEGVHKPTVADGNRARDPNDFTDLGSQLFKKQPGATKANAYRPVTPAEKAATRRLSRLADRRSLAAGEAEWLRGSYPVTAGQQLSAREARRQRSIHRQAARYEKKAQKSTVKFNKITASNNLGGRIAQWRLARNSR